MFPLAFLAGALTLHSPQLEIFPETISPSKKFAVIHSVGKNKEDVNSLINLNTYKPIAVLKDFSGFVDENHGGMFATYSKKEDYAVILHAGKWQPQHMAVVETKNGRQVDVLQFVRNNVVNYLNNHGNKAVSKLYTTDVTDIKFTNNRATFYMISEVPKQENDIFYYSLSVDVTNLKLTRPSLVKLTEKEYEKQRQSK